MTRDEFEALLLLHGGDLGRWPEADAEAAARLLDQDAQARKLMEEARELDGLLASAVSDDAAGSALTGRVLAHVHGTRGGVAGWRWPLAGAGAALAAAGVVGFVVGLFHVSASGDALLALSGADLALWALL